MSCIENSEGVLKISDKCFNCYCIIYLRFDRIALTFWSVSSFKNC